MIWSDYPLGSTATHDRYELSTLTETIAPRADGSYLWIASVECDRIAGQDSCIALVYGLASREVAKVVAAERLAAAIEAMNVSDAEFTALARSVVGNRGWRDALQSVGVGSVAVERWSRGDRLPKDALRPRSVLAIRRFLEERGGAQ